MPVIMKSGEGYIIGYRCSTYSSETIWFKVDSNFKRESLDCRCYDPDNGLGRECSKLGDDKRSCPEVRRLFKDIFRINDETRNNWNQ